MVYNGIFTPTIRIGQHEFRGQNISFEPVYGEHAQPGASATEPVVEVEVPQSGMICLPD